MRVPSASHAALIGRVEAKRRIRVLEGSKLQAGALLVAGLFLLVFSGGAALAAYYIGGELAGTDLSNVERYARLGAAALFLAATVLTGLRIVGEQGAVDHEAGMLTTVPHQDVVGGILLAELAGAVAYAGLPVLAVSGALALGAGSLVLGVSLLGAVALVGVLGVCTGHAVGYVLRYGFARSETLARHKTKLAVALFLAYFYVVGVSQDVSFFVPLLEGVGTTPIGWVGLLPLAVLGEASATLALVGVGVTVAALPVLLVAMVAAAGDAWYADEVSPSDGEGVREETSVSAGPLERVIGRPTAWVARTAWTRAYRGPIKLVFVLYPAFGLLGPVVDAVQTGQVPTILPVLFAVYGAWAAGAGFALNPLGDEGAMLPVTLTSGVPGTEFVRGLVTAAALAGAPVVIPLAIVSGVFVPFSPLQLGFLAVSTAALLVGAPMLATGIGVAFPRFESVRISRSRRVVAPSVVAFAVYSLVLVLVATPGLATQVPVVADALATWFGVPVTTLRAAGSLLTAALVALCGYVSYRWAVGEIETYTL